MVHLRMKFGHTFIFDVFLDLQTVQVSKYWCDVVIKANNSDDACQQILHKTVYLCQLRLYLVVTSCDK